MTTSHVMSGSEQEPHRSELRARTAIIFATVALAACLQACSNRMDSAAVAADIAPADDEYLRAAAAQWDSLFNARLATELASTYCEDYVSMPDDSPDIRGRIARQGRFVRFFADYIATHETEVEELIMSKDCCIELADYTLTYGPRWAPDQTTRESGRQVTCRKKINGKWLIAWKVRNTDQPSAEAPEV